VRPQNPGQHLEQRALARPVVTDDAKKLASGHVEADVAECPQVLPLTATALSNDLLERLVTAPVDAVALGETLHPDNPVRHPTPPQRSRARGGGRQTTPAPAPVSRRPRIREVGSGPASCSSTRRPGSC